MKEIVIKICGIDCAACVDRLNRTLGETEGVLEAAMTLSSNGVLLNSLRLQKAGEKKNERRNGAD